uniref:MFS transporter n=1 Tax=Cognatishimia sp. TaxID=2211648 RepID=UPI00351351D4
LSDQTRHRLGPRVPWMLVGVPGLAIAAWLLLNPVDGAGLLYLVAVSACFFLFYTVLDVPYSSIGLELSPDTHARSYLASSKAVFQVIGAILASLIPVLVTSQMGVSLQIIAMVAVGLMVLGLVAFLAFVPRVSGAQSPARVGLLEGWRAVLEHTEFRFLAITFFVVQGANALTAGLLVLYITHVLQRPDFVGPFFLIMFVSTAGFLPLWVFLSKRFSKQGAWMTSIALCASVLVAAALFGQGNLALLVAFALALGAAFGCDAIMPTSMLADLVYEGDAQNDSRRAATFLAVKNAVSKLTFVLPMGLAFPVLDLVDFNEGGANGTVQVTALVVFFAWLPAALRGLAFLLLTKMKLQKAAV